ncbi:hypothetical protein OG259_37925 [Streptomyces sp. NBC_00250]|nr:hypothetical protein [Streptomyces sp. NBC_00250]
MVEFAGEGLSADVVDVGYLVDVVADPGQGGTQGSEFVDGRVESFVGVQGGRTAGGGQAGGGEESGDGDAAQRGGGDDLGFLSVGEAGGRLAGALARVAAAAARLAVGEGGRARARLLAVGGLVCFSPGDRRPLVLVARLVPERPRSGTSRASPPSGAGASACDGP